MFKKTSREVTNDLSIEVGGESLERAKEKEVERKRLELMEARREEAASKMKKREMKRTRRIGMRERGKDLLIWLPQLLLELLLDAIARLQQE